MPFAPLSLNSLPLAGEVAVAALDVTVHAWPQRSRPQRAAVTSHNAHVTVDQARTTANQVYLSLLALSYRRPTPPATDYD
jgi:phosphoglycerate dehydrogenase-like enzyme